MEFQFEINKSIQYNEAVINVINYIMPVKMSVFLNIHILGAQGPLGPLVIKWKIYVLMS